MKRATKIFVVAYTIDGVTFEPLVVETEEQSAIKWCGLKQKENKFYAQYLKVYWTFTGNSLHSGLQEIG